MASGSQHIYSHLLNVDRQVPQSLRGIDDQPSATLFGHHAPGTQILDGSGDVGGMTNDNPTGIGSQALAGPLDIHPANFIARNKVYLDTARLF
jgi:hypothetical protein